MSENNGEIIFAVEEAPEGGYVARALGHSIFTEADDLDSLRASVRDAVRCHFDDGDRPKIIRLRVTSPDATSPRLSANSATRSLARPAAICG